MWISVFCAILHSISPPRLVRTRVEELSHTTSIVHPLSGAPPLLQTYEQKLAVLWPNVIIFTHFQVNCLKLWVWQDDRLAFQHYYTCRLLSCPAVMLHKLLAICAYSYFKHLQSCIFFYFSLFQVGQVPSTLSLPAGAQERVIVRDVKFTLHA